MVLNREKNSISFNFNFKYLDLIKYSEIIKSKILINYYKILYKIHGDVSEIKIMRCLLEIKDIPITFYFVFNEPDKQFLEGVEYIIDTLELLPSSILESIKDTTIVVKAREELDKYVQENFKETSKRKRAIGGYTSFNYNYIVVFANILKPFILHEIGHVYGNLYSDFKWHEIILLEGERLLSKISFLSAYGIKDYFYKPSEYFADCFCYYYLYPERREELLNIAPNTYNLLESILETDRKIYKK